MTDPGRPRVAILDDYQAAALRFADWSPVTGRADVTVFPDHLEDVGAVADRLRPFEVVCAMRERTAFTRDLLERLPELKLLVTTGMANAAIDLDAARARGVTVCGTGSVAHATPELTWALILAATRDLRAETASVAAGGWQVGVGGDLRGRTLGTLGLGRIGSAVAAVGLAFGMRVVAWSQNLTADTAAAHGVARVEKEQLFREADVLTIHLKLSERTRGLVGASELGAMKPGALLVNTSRGPIVDEAALLAALRERRIAGAALDVFEPEPLPAGHPFRSMPNVLATPHIGYVTRATYEVFFRETVEDVAAWLDGRPVRVLT